jgi:hypothetical protein
MSQINFIWSLIGKQIKFGGHHLISIDSLVTLLVRSNTFRVVSLNHFRQETDFAQKMSQCPFSLMLDKFIIFFWKYKIH